MKRTWLLAVVIIGLLVSAQGVRAETANRLGVGVNYWTLLDNVNVDSIDESGSSWLFTYQHRASPLVKLEADLEVFDKGYLGVDSTVIAPEAYLVLGMAIYAAVGVGILYADGDFADDVFYALRAGLDLEIFPQLYLDVNANYRFAKWSNLSDKNTDVDGDTVTLGAALRLGF